MLLRPLHKDLEFMPKECPMTRAMQNYIWSLMSRPEHKVIDYNSTENNDYIDDSHSITNIKRNAQELLVEQSKSLSLYIKTHP